MMMTARRPFAICRLTRPTIAVLCLSLLAAGCGSSDPFSYVKVSGKITYDDGSLVPVDGLLLTFHPQCGPLDAKTYPGEGLAKVDRATGEFHLVTSHKFNDGLVRGRHKVTVGIPQPLPPSIVPPEYSDPATTPLEVDTANLPFLLKVRKPGGGR